MHIYVVQSISKLLRPDDDQHNRNAQQQQQQLFPVINSLALTALGEGHRGLLRYCIRTHMLSARGLPSVVDTFTKMTIWHKNQHQRKNLPKNVTFHKE